MNKLLVFLCGTVFMATVASADEAMTVLNEDEAVIFDETLLPVASEDEPEFRSPMVVRDIAQFKEDSSETTNEWQGQLSILKEIPYSYPQLTRRSLANKVLAELEASEK